MSIHGVLAALLGSSALGGFAPLTLLRMQRYYLTGASKGDLLASETHFNIQSGLLKDSFYGTELHQLALLQDLMFKAYSISQMIILGFTGMMPTLTSLQTLFYDPSMTGYGTDYGYSYGD